ncbi:MAG TPA: hypothetical protein VGK96_07245 [Candidatus Sulfotelmatobacter sp.]|jgi:hypothetical protein
MNTEAEVVVADLTQEVAMLCQKRVIARECDCASLLQGCISVSRLN